MPLDSQQKNYIKKNIKKIRLEEISGNLSIDKNDVLDYLRKKWRKEKFQKFIRENETKKISQEKSTNFFSENRLAIFTLIGLIFAIYINSLNNGFVSDDIGAIIKNETIGNFSAVFSSIFGSLQSFIRFLTFRVFELNPAPYRLLNILLHTGSTILIFFILNILHKRSLAFFAALLFAVHPMLAEAITWISGMPYSLYSFLFLFSFYFYLLSENNRRCYYFSVGLFFLACISSEKAIPLFLIFALYEWIYKRNGNFWKNISPFFGTALILGIVFAGGFGQRTAELESGHYQPGEETISPFAQIPVAVANYLGLLIWPAKLTLYHTEMRFSSGMYFLMSIVFLVALSALIYFFVKNKFIFFWLAFFFVALFVTLAPLGIAWIVAERYAYLASLGIFVIAAFGLEWLYNKLKSKGIIFEKIFYAFLIMIIISLSIRTIVRNNDWQNEDTLWFATAKVSPSGQVIHNNLGDVYGRQGNFEKSVEEFKKAIEINPLYAEAYHNLANTYQEMNQKNLAIENYQKALALNPRLWQSHQNLAAVYFDQGDYQKALEHIQKALEINPADENLQQNLEVIDGKIK